MILSAAVHHPQEMIGLIAVRIVLPEQVRHQTPQQVRLWSILLANMA
jgi:hypothetical protein